MRGDTSGGVALIRSTGRGRLPPRKDVGYDNAGVWVKRRLQRRIPALGPGSGARDGCARTGHRAHAGGRVGRVYPRQWFRSSAEGTRASCPSACGLLRYVDQMPGHQTFTDHLGNTRTVDGAQRHLAAPGHGVPEGMARRPEADLHDHLLDRCSTPTRTPSSRNLGYQFSRKFSVYAGLNGNPGRARSRARIPSGSATIA